MSKPRICDVLGVETEERFRIRTRSGEFYIGGGGYLNRDNDDCMMDADTLCEIINCPDLIIHKKYKQKDIDDAKAIKRLMPWAQIVGRNEYGSAFIYVGESTGRVVIDAGCFPSIKSRECEELDKIIYLEAE